MSDLKISVSIDARDTRSGADAAKREIRGVGDEAEKTARRVSSVSKVDFSGAIRQIKSYGESIKNAGAAITGFGTKATLAITTPIVALSTLGIKFNAMKESALTSFTVLLKSGEKAKSLFGDLNKFAADTPFEMPELLGATRSLLAFGVAQEQVLPTLKRLGDIASGVGAPVGELAELYGKAKVQGRLFAEDINQLTGRGIPIIQELAKQFGVSDDKVKGLVESGKIGFPQLEKAFADLTAEGGTFAGQTEALSKTFSGQLSTLSDNINQSLGDISAPLFDLLKDNLPVLINLVTQASSAFQNLSPTMQTVISVILAVAAAIGPVLVVIGTLITFIGSVITAIATVAGAIGTVAGAVGGLGPLILIAAAAFAYIVVIFGTVIAAAYALYLAWQDNFGGVRDFTIEVWNGIKQFISSAIEQISAYVQVTLAGIKAFWNENGEDIKRAATTAYAFIANIVKGYLDAIRKFWEVNGASIIAIVKSAFEIIKAVVTAGINVVSNVIKLVSAIINGDWRSAWESAKAIVQTINGAIFKILLELAKIVFNAFNVVQNTITAAGVAIFNKAVEIGKNLLQGLINGMSSLKDKVISTARDIITAPLNIFRSVPQVQSPSRVTTEIGEFIAEGLAIGMENKLDRVKNASKRIANEAIKNLRDALKEFQKLAGASPETVQAIQQTNKVQEATSQQSEIIKLRQELGQNQYKPLPSSIDETQRELVYLQQQKQAVEDVNKSYDDQRQTLKDIEDAYEKEQVAFADKIEKMRQSGDLELLNAQKEFDLLGVTDEVEKQRIENAYDLIKLRQQLYNDGYGEKQIQEALEVLKVENARVLEFIRLKQLKQQQIDADKKIKEEELKAAEEAKKQYEGKVKGLADSFSRIFSAGATDGFKGFLKQSLEELKNFGRKLLDDVLNSLAEGLSKFIFGKLGKGSSSGGGFLQTILGSIFGGGSSSNNGGSSSGSGIFGFIKNLFGRSSPSGGLTSTADITRTVNTPDGGTATAGGAIGLAGGIAIAGAAANLIGGLIGGRAGGFISNIGSGAALGAQIGSVIPGIGTLIGAGVGAVGGFLASLFGGDPKKKRDKNEKLPQLQKGFSDALNQLRALGADKNALYNDPQGTIAKALELRGQIASGFGLQFESKKYRKQSQSLIAAKLVEADAIIANLQKLKDQAVRAGDIDTRLQTSFATGAYISPAFLKQYGDFKRRNGILAGKFTGIDTLPSLLATGEMVLNPTQIQQVILNSNTDDPFRNAGIPGYSTGTYISASTSTSPSASPVSVSSSVPSVTIEKISILLEGEGMSNVKVKEILIDNLKKSDVQVEVVNAYDKGKARTK